MQNFKAVEAVQDETGIDFMPYRVNIKTDNGSRMLCRCDSAADAALIARALGGTNRIEAMSDREVLVRISEALAGLQEVNERHAVGSGWAKFIPGHWQDLDEKVKGDNVTLNAKKVRITL